jgi:hypothetical protein
VPAALVVLAAALGFAIVASADPGTILRFDTMAPVTGPYVGMTNPIRGVDGGGLPWVIASGRGSLGSDGDLSVRVRGLVLARQSPVPPALQGTNPVKQFKAIVSCLTISPNGAATYDNVMTGPFSASSSGDSRIRTTVHLPHPCIAPIVFVTSPTALWFAATGD